MDDQENVTRGDITQADLDLAWAIAHYIDRMILKQFPESGIETVYVGWDSPIPVMLAQHRLSNATCAKAEETKA